jgi:predicted Rossmann fold nucleotide-binding protein DprA/Smf involved in DNA uptake
MQYFLYPVAVIVAGSRTIKQYDLVDFHIQNSKLNVNKIISGGAKGVDSLAIDYAEKNNINYDKLRKSKIVSFSYEC